MSLLPVNSSLLERGLVSAFEKLLYESPNPYPNLLNAEKTPERLLPYLAHDRGVREWQSDALEIEKRDTAQAAWMIRRKAGTIAAIEEAVSTLGYQVSCVPWYESKQAPYHLDLMIFLDDKELPAEVEQRITDRLKDAISLRDQYTINYSRNEALDVNTGVGIETWEIIDLVPDQPDSLDSYGRLNSAVVCSQLEVITINVERE